MTCCHADCRQPIERCYGARSHPPGLCRGWVHSATGYHRCRDLDMQLAEPEPGTLPGVSDPVPALPGKVVA